MNMALSIPQPLEIRKLGNGKRKVLALHCTLAHSGAWKGLVAEMDSEIEVTATDMFNHGLSPDWDGQGDFQDRMARAAVATLTEPVDVIGHSFGASIAMRVAVLFPELVRSLTMIESVYFAIVKKDRPELVEASMRSSAPFYNAMEAGDVELGARLFNGGWGGGVGESWEEMPEHRRAAMIRGAQIVPACSPALLDDIHNLLEPGKLQSLNLPVLLMRGGNTADIIAAVNDGFAEYLPDARNVVVEGAGHMLPISHPAETADHLRQLFTEVPA